MSRSKLSPHHCDKSDNDANTERKIVGGPKFAAKTLDYTLLLSTCASCTEQQRLPEELVRTPVAPAKLLPSPQLIAFHPVELSPGCAPHPRRRIRVARRATVQARRRGLVLFLCILLVDPSWHHAPIVPPRARWMRMA